MRLVTYVGYCDEVGEDEYAANEVTYLFNTPAMSGAERHQFVLPRSEGCGCAKTTVQLRPILPYRSSVTAVYA